MENQIRQWVKDLLASKAWASWAMAGAICLIAVVLKPLLFLLALVFFGRALWLAIPELTK